MQESYENRKTPLISINRKTPSPHKKKSIKEGAHDSYCFDLHGGNQWRINKSSCRAFLSYAQVSGRIETEGKPRTIQILLTSHLSRHSSSEEVWDQHNKIEKPILMCSPFLGAQQNQQTTGPSVTVTSRRSKTKPGRLIAGTFQGCTSSFPP